MLVNVSVAAIENGTVIDHIPAGQSPHIIKFLKLNLHRKRVTFGLNLTSLTMGYKDLIKIEDREISEKEAERIAIFAPQATFNIIQNYKVVKKFVVPLPERIEGMFQCENPLCITNHEPMAPVFAVQKYGKKVELHCHYCRCRVKM